ncbi:substrate-binding domain-containing protein [Anoxybacillus sp. LAT_35]|uniref:substrate-binding domain-containing protein n=1 Tax=unclassified Anoxybacillus TaxID=2639704 RepID=UPI001EDA7CCC|nr:MULTISPECIES: substrate-binding domain-containing protein [unclassified Anoxybacillus]MCG5025587.1 substrate-binding domain-containing protein [Anoxybacillus flavithermus]MCG6196550.1 substrate-binding domain-containing protein [Anoxybacillus sp. LAT_38]MCG3083954.1 substrate-binding domain-containing protein [Anoxybacillus sp. LAT27]MCG6172299.1 substrate-binding domain-containing protein [Anoxybacillus sp. LAT_11]MCG6175508.1 substrate-binding domain-containing protein [Anoxybacillus sp. 
MKRTTKCFLYLLVVMLVILGACSSNDAGVASNENDKPKKGTNEKTEEVVRIGVLASLTGALEVYGKQTVRGFELGLEYATGGTMEVAGKKIEYIVEDTETQPNVAVQKATRLLEDHQVDFIVGSSSSGDTLAVLPLMEEYKKIMIVEPAVADSITGENWNRYIFRTARSSSQDAIAGATAIAAEGVTIATLAQDSAFGRDGVAAFKKAAEELGAKIVHEEYADPSGVDFSSNIQRIVNAKPEYLFVIWAGANSPWGQLADMKVQERGIKISTGAPDIAALRTMDAVIGMEGFTVYHHSLPNNEINDWLVKKHLEKFGEEPDLFTPGGFAAAMAIVTALEKSGGVTDAETLIETMEGMTFDTPKGPMTFRPEDHQALQTMYAITLKRTNEFDYPVPVLVRELTSEETAPPIKNR